jgi:hypothetical protein
MDHAWIDLPCKPAIMPGHLRRAQVHLRSDLPTRLSPLPAKRDIPPVHPGFMPRLVEDYA